MMTFKEKSCVVGALYAVVDEAKRAENYAIKAASSEFAKEKEKKHWQESENFWRERREVAESATVKILQMKWRD